MNKITTSLQNACRNLLRPLAHAARRALTPPEPPIEFDWHPIVAGPATGARLLLPKNTAIAKAITEGIYEHHVLSVVQSLVGSNDVCFDIGGHYGYYTVCLANLAATGQVHTFEPVTSHAERIEQAVKQSGLGHVTIHPVAVAGEVGEMTLQHAQTGQGDDSMAYLADYGGVDTPAAHEHYRSFRRTQVRTVTLDWLGQQLPPPRFIKIDAEGAEAAILGGGQRMIAEAQPRLLIEMHGIYEAIQCAEILSRLDYCAVLLTDQKTTMPILWVPHDDEEAIASVGTALGADPVVLFRPVTGSGGVSVDPSSDDRA